MSPRLPNTWVSASLDQLGTWLGGGTPSKANPAYWQNGTIHWVSPKDMKRLLIDSAQDQITKKAVTESATNLVPANSVLMVTRSGILSHTFPVGINTVDVAINQDIKAWTPVGAVDSTYAAYFLKARGQHILRMCSKDGTTVSSIEFDRLANFPVFVAPANEQRRIVSKIDELFSRIDEGERALKRVEKLVERYRQSVLKAAVTGELTRDWRDARKRAGESVESGAALLARILKARRAAWEAAELAKLKAKGKPPTDDHWKQKYKEPEPPNTTNLPELPEGWVWASMSQIAWSSSYGTSSKCTYEARGVPVLRIPNIRSGRVNFSNLKYATSDQGLADDDMLSQGDLLVVRTNGSGSLIGVGCVVTEQTPLPCYFASYLIRFRLALPEQLASWVNICWQSYVVRSFVAEHKATSAGQYNVSQSSLMELCIPVPPFNEMPAISGAVALATSDAGSALTSAAVSTRAAIALRQSILRTAFSGQLVPQDPNDEPASALLERIAAERGNAAPSPLKRKKKSA